MHPLKVAIVGYGIGGIAAAIQLRRQGHHITHFDRNRPPAAVGAGMLLHPPALRQLRILGVLEAALACGAPVRRIAAQTTRGRTLFDLGYSEVVDSPYGLGIQRGTLHRLLSDADTERARVLGGRDIISADPHGGYLVEASRERHGPFDLVVVADGANSTLRDQLPISARRDERADTAALVTLIDDPDRLAMDRLTQYFDGAHHLSAWPVGIDDASGLNRCSVAMNVSCAEAESMREQGHWRDHAGRLCPRIGRLLREQSSDSRPYLFTYRDVELSTHIVGRVILIGDAAHSMSPQLGVGAQLAMQDAELLAGMIAKHGNVDLALRAYTQTRPMQLSRYQQASRWLTPLFQSSNLFVSGIRELLLTSTMRTPMARRFAQEILG
jgi:2-polyprenyl-6-methoxyphenol hydroxylase-like FAD-dependent oxidoreductase